MVVTVGAVMPLRIAALGIGGFPFAVHHAHSFGLRRLFEVAGCFTLDGVSHDNVT